MPLIWKFSASELNRIQSEILRKSSIYSLARKIKSTGLFSVVAPRPLDDTEEGYRAEEGWGWCLEVAEEGVSGTHVIHNMYHFKTLCLRNGVNLKKLLMWGKMHEADKNGRGFKTVGRAPRESVLPKRKIEDML